MPFKPPSPLPRNKFSKIVSAWSRLWWATAILTGLFVSFSQFFPVSSSAWYRIRRPASSSDSPFSEAYCFTSAFIIWQGTWKASLIFCEKAASRSASSPRRPWCTCKDLSFNPNSSLISASRLKRQTESAPPDSAMITGSPGCSIWCSFMVCLTFCFSFSMMILFLLRFFYLSAPYLPLLQLCCFRALLIYLYLSP